RPRLAVEEALRLGIGHVDAGPVDVPAPGGEDVDDLVGIHAGAGAEGGPGAARLDQLHHVARPETEFAGDAGADGDPLPEPVDVAQRVLRPGHARDRFQVLGRDAVDLGDIRPLVRGDHRLPPDHRSAAGDAATWAWWARIVSTHSARTPALTAIVATSAITPSVTPTRLIQVITLTPPSARRARR